MAKFTLIYDDREDYDYLGAKRTYEFDTVTWGEALEHFQHFLNGNGFIIPQTDINIRELCEGYYRENCKQKI